MVGPAHLTNAVTLNSVVMNVGMTVGPALAGVLIANLGLAVSFLLNALSHGTVLTGLLLMRTDQLYRRRSRHASARRSGKGCATWDGRRSCWA